MTHIGEENAAFAPLKRCLMQQSYHTVVHVHMDTLVPSQVSKNPMSCPSHSSIFCALDRNSAADSQSTLSPNLRSSLSIGLNSAWISELIYGWEGGCNPKLTQINASCLSPTNWSFSILNQRIGSSQQASNIRTGFWQSPATDHWAAAKGALRAQHWSPLSVAAACQLAAAASRMPRWPWAFWVILNIDYWGAIYWITKNLANEELGYWDAKIRIPRDAFAVHALPGFSLP